MRRSSIGPPPLAHDYDGYYAEVIDSLFTPEDCAALIALAKSDQAWEPAAVNFGSGARRNYTKRAYRNSERSLRFDHEAADRIYQRLLPYIQEFVEIKAGNKWEDIIGQPGYILIGNMEVGRVVLMKSELPAVWSGALFRRHCNGQLQLPNGRMSRVTLQIYLGDDEVEGGTTRFMGNHKNFLDIEPKKGRVLIFQQRGMFHSGEEVIKGVKYSLRSDFMFRRTKD